MGRIDSNQNSFNNNTNQPNPPQPPQDHQYPHQQPTNYVTPDTIDIVPPPPYDSTYDTNHQDNTEENKPEIQQNQFNHPPPQPSPIHPTHEVLSQPVTYSPAQTAGQPSPLHPTHVVLSKPVTYSPAQTAGQPSPMHPTHEVLSQPVMYPPAQPTHEVLSQPVMYPSTQKSVPRSPMHPTHEVLSHQPVMYPPQAQHSPMHPTHEIISQQPVMYPPAHAAVQFPPPSPHMGRANTFPPQPTNQPPLSVATGGPIEMPGKNAYTIVTPIYNGWRTGLLDCMVDPENAIQTALFPCVTFGQIAEIVDEGATSCGTSGLLFMVIAPTGMPWLLTCMYRAKLRKRYGLEESPAADWAVHLICGLCGLCQEYRELQARGIDPSVGWHGNMGNSQKGQQLQATMTPPTNQRMMG